jgi:hypothetical protein
VLVGLDLPENKIKIYGGFLLGVMELVCYFVLQTNDF